jgi:hypothetical protein
VPVATAGVALVLQGRRMAGRATVVPRRTVQAVRETSEWLREEMT